MMDFQSSEAFDNVSNDEPDGAGGGGKGAGKAGGGTEAPNTLRSKAIGRFLFLLGEGEIAGLVDGAKSIILSKVPYENADGTTNYKGLQWSMKPGTPDQTALPGFENATSEYDVNLRVKQGTPVVYRTESSTLDAITVTLNVPQLTFLDDKTSTLKGYHFDIAIDVKNISNPNNAWVEKVRDYQSGKNTSPYERSYRIDVDGVGPWLVRMRRLTPDHDDNSKISDQTYFGHITEISDYSVAYADSAILGVEIDVEQLGSKSDLRFDVKGKKINYPSNYDPVARTFSGFWNGTFSYGWCNDPAWVMMDVLMNPRYGIGLPQAMIDKWGLYQLSQFCSQLVPDGEGGMEPRFTFNGTFYNDEEAYKTIQAIASMMRAIVFYGAGALVVRHDAPMSPEQRVYNPTNVIGDFSYSSTAKSVRHNACVVQWVNPALGWEDDYEVYEDRAAIIKHGYNPLSIRAIGTTSRGQAYRQAKWAVLTEQLQTDTVTFEAGMDSASVLPGDIIEVADPHWATADFGGRLVQPEAKNLLSVTGAQVSSWGVGSGATKPGEYRESAWSKTGLAKVVANTASSSHGTAVATGVTNVINSPYTVSVEVDAEQYSYFLLNYTRGSVSITASFDLASGTVRGKYNSLIRNAGIQHLGGTRYRIWMSLISFSDTVAPSIGVYFDRPTSPAVVATTGALSAWVPLGTETAWFGAPQFETGLEPTAAERPRANGTTQFYLDRSIEYTGATAPQLHMTLLTGAPDDIANVDNTDRPIRREIRYLSSNVTAYNAETNMVTLQTAVSATGDDSVTPLVWIFSKTQQVPRAYKVISNEEDTDENTYRITGLEYSTQKFVQMDEGFVIDYDPGENYSNLPSTNFCKPPSNMRVEVSNLGGQRRLNVSWTASPDNFLAGYIVAYKVDDENWVELPIQSHNYYELDAQIGSYIFTVRAVNHFGVQSSAITQGLSSDELDPSADAQVLTIYTDQGNATFIDRDIRLYWTSRAGLASTVTPAFRADVTKPALTVTTVAGEQTVQGGVGGTSTGALTVNVSNINAPTVTGTGTFEKGDTARVFIGQSIFTYTVVGATETAAYVTAQLATAINADARFDATASAGVITVTFFNGGTNASNLTAADDPTFRRFRVRVIDPITQVQKRVEYTTSPELTYSYAANQQDFGTAVRTVKFAVSIEDADGVFSAETTVVMTNPAPTAPTVLVEAVQGHATFRYTPPTDPDFAGMILYVSNVSGFVPGPANLVFKDRGNPTIPIANPGTYYYKFGFFDSFGDGGIALSAQASFTVADNTISAPALTAPDWPATPLTSATAIDSVTGEPVTTLTINWNRGTNAANDVRGYEVEIRETTTGAWIGGYTTAGDINTLVVPRVAPNRYYQARVRAFNSLGQASSYSTVRPADPGHLTGKDTVAPQPPTSVTASAAFRTVFLQWTNTNNAADTDLTGVEIWENTVNNSATATRIDVVNAIKGLPGTYTRSGLTTNVTRYYWLKSVDGSGNVSGFHAAATAGVAVTTAYVPAIDLEGALASANFPEALRPVEILGALPVTGLTNGRQVYLTTDGKTYRYRTSPAGWTTATDGADITPGSILTDKIASGQITTALLAAQSVLASKLFVGDTSNMVPDSDLVDRGAWANTTLFTLDAITAGASRNKLTLPASYVGNVVSAPIPVEATKPYYFSGKVEVSSAGNASGRMWVAWYSNSDGNTYVSGDDIVPSTTTVAGTSANKQVVAPSTAKTVRIVFERASAGTGAATASYSSPIMRRAATGELIVDGTITGAKILAGEITTNHITINTLNGDRILAGTITASKIFVSGDATKDKMPTGLLIGETGVTIGAVKTNADTGISNAATADGKAVAADGKAVTADGKAVTADGKAVAADGKAVAADGKAVAADNKAVAAQTTANDPITQANTKTTLLLPGLIQISGTTTLSNWRQGGDTTKIAGGSISANTITANKLTVGNRGINVAGIEFEYKNGQLYWQNGHVFYTDDAGNPQAPYVAPGNVAFTAGQYTYVYWVKGAATLSTTTDWGGMLGNTNNVLFCTWMGGVRFVANYGGTIVHGDNITAGSVKAVSLSVGSLDAITGVIGTLRTASSGSRLELHSNVLKVFEGETLRVKIGNLAL